ncbi:TRAP transporter substrate-binding protein [Celerinatantimonas diazotrophica]|uniref:TRAP-type C4-dicarboxylate transport system substrate-binding protein n=1 Tax=Celerinatantimonas diazotrophica TaxID=412034 RepID=A0A4R1K194_9GAMM|nr:TRAP transporter substrate-binding protein DctP [Celerinatantimonas diazotrophica]TCK57766.1 TRAP-type C4-dicarboxylate transport system substrate-binding protein [Celerinatantimonas diazotrophica]CAG9298171.1 2,3-diketo-L-gulonate-binding periplasmic protein YiaO [Celerinatantimonas diazotrophica]
MINKCLKLLLSMSIALISILGLTSPSAFASDLTVRFAWYMPPHTATANQAETIAKNIKEMSHGSIKVLTYPSGSLLKASNIANGLANNTANMGINAMHWWSKYAPALQWDTIPFLAPNATTLLKALHGKLGKDVDAILEKHGVHVVAWGFYGYAKSYVNSKRTIIKPADLKGLRMRSEGSLSAMFLKSQGATPVAMDSSEVYTSMQRGALDGATSGLSTITSRKWYEVGKYVTAIHYVPLVYPVQVNLKWWKGLTQQQRDLITKAAKASEKAAVQDIENEFTNDIKLLKAKGNHVTQLTGKQLTPWKETAGVMERKLYLKETGATGQKILDDLKPYSK